MNIVGDGAAFCMGCCPNIHNGTAIAAAAPAAWVSPPMRSVSVVDAVALHCVTQDQFILTKVQTSQKCTFRPLCGTNPVKSCGKQRGLALQPKHRRGNGRASFSYRGYTFSRNCFGTWAQMDTIWGYLCHFSFKPFQSFQSTLRNCVIFGDKLMTDELRSTDTPYCAPTPCPRACIRVINKHVTSCWFYELLSVFHIGNNPTSNWRILAVTVTL